MAETERTYRRFNRSQRLQHWVMTLSFTVLAITGLPQRYALADWAEWMIAAMGGIETVRIIHRTSAVIFILVSLYHVIALAHGVFVTRGRMTMLPGLKDVTDMLDAIRYNLGLARQHPKFPHFNVAEKIEYWSLVWGSVLMIITGFMLWNPIATARFLPGEFIPAAKTAHSAEALLAALAVLIWHFYGVHIKMFNRSMFTGRLTRKQMEEEHAAELEEIEAGVTRPPVPRDVTRRRERVFLPMVVVVSLVLAIGLYAFLTFEQTAITTVPPAEEVQAFVLATPTPTHTPTITPTPTETPVPTATPEGGEVAQPAGEATVQRVPMISHPLEGREDCLLCHASEALQPFPANHEGLETTTCLVCHSTEGEGPAPASVKHDLAGREDCLMCHALDLLPESHQAAEFASPDCTMCHAEAGTKTTERSSTGEEKSFAGDIQPLLEANCATCHAEMALGGLQVTAYEPLMAGGENGPAIVAGSPEESLMVAKMDEEHPALLTGDDLLALIDWIAAGAENN